VVISLSFYNTKSVHTGHKLNVSFGARFFCKPRTIANNLSVGQCLGKAELPKRQRIVSRPRFQ